VIKQLMAPLGAVVNAAAQPRSTSQAVNQISNNYPFRLTSVQNIRHPDIPSQNPPFFAEEPFSADVVRI
jgi:hypothetical protein